MDDPHIALEKRYCASNYAPLPIVLHKGKGIYVTDTKGKRYIDMLSAYSALSHGHNHPKIVRALKKQLKLLSLSSRAFYSENLGELFQKLCALSGLDLGLPMNTGAEAVETAMKAARRWGYRVKKIPSNSAEIIVCKGNFHGRTTTVISASSEPSYKADFGPLTPGFRLVPFGDAEAIAAAINPHTCAVLMEPMQGEGGIIIPHEGYLKQVETICRKHNVLFILDEVQTGFGRTGRDFAFQHEGIHPDGLILGKALGGGLLPISAFLAKRDILELFEPGSHGSTFGGNPLAVAVAIAALDVFIEDRYSQRSTELGHYMLERLSKHRAHPAVVDIRGKGLWIGLELNPDVIVARTFCERLMEEGVLAKETHGVVVRFAPPLIIQKKEIDLVLNKIDKVFKSFDHQ